MRRPHSAQPIIVDSLPLAAPGVDRRLHVLCVPCDDQVRQQRQGARNRDHFVTTTAALRRDFARVDRTLELVYRLTAIE
jgi:hypothetical protein